MALRLARGALASAKLNQLARYAHQAAGSRFSDSLRSYAMADVTELDNGIKVATEKTNSPLATVGVWVESGNRNEPKELNGITNFVEQVIYKGTKSRSKKQLEKDVYGLGAILNSFNNRENSGFYATLAPSEVSKAVELLAEAVQNPALNSEDIEEGRNNILRELNNCEFNYEQVVMDYLHSVAYMDTPLALSKYGPSVNIKRFTRADIEKGFDLLFNGPRIVVAASGNVDHEQIVKLAQQGFKGLKVDKTKNSSLSTRYTGSDIRVRDDSMDCAHVALAVEGPGYSNPDFIAMEIAASIFRKWDLTHGGEMNAYNYIGPVTTCQNMAQLFKSFNVTYRDTALWGAYFVGERMQLEDFVMDLLSKWRHIALKATNNQIQMGKNGLFTKLISEREGCVNNANSIASDILRFGRRLTLEEWQAKISQVDKHKIHKVAENYVWDRCPVVSAVGAVEGLDLYDNLRMQMSSYLW